MDGPFTDTFNRQVDYLRVSVTDRCNLKCLYCVPDAGVRHFADSEIISTDELIRFVRSAHRNGVSEVRITGASLS